MSSIFTNFRTLWRSVTRSNVGLATVPIVLVIFVGTIVYSWLEDWTVWESLYATIITITTVGYGDYSPQTFGGQLFAIFFTIVAISFAGYAISTMAAVVIEHEAGRAEREAEEQRMKQISELSNHIIVCGASIVAHRFADELYRRGQPFVFVEQDEQKLRWALLWMNRGYVAKRFEQYHNTDDSIAAIEEENMSISDLAADMGILYLLEDPVNEQILRRAGIGRATGLMAGLDDDRDNLSIVLSARHMSRQFSNEKLRIVARVLDEYNMRRMYLAGADKVTSPNFVGGYHMASQMISPVLGDFLDQMLLKKNHSVGFYDWSISDHPELVGKTVRDVVKAGHTLLAVQRDEQFIFTPDRDLVLKTTDVLILLGEVA